VQGKNLTILFGQSGLGKTSLLRAGVVPRLRREGFCPVYVRIDYAPESPPPSEQIKRAIFRATEAAGVWTRPGTAVEGESLWEFLHHRGDLLRDAQGKSLLPLLIFDQFEEIFTLGQADDTGRERAKEFLADLADLVENRPPQSLEQRLETDDSIVDNFDFARADYRVLIALREDYLAHLESLKGTMPSITQNRMRLARMTGHKALDAVIQPGGMLVTREVAEAIVRFVAGGTELANAEVEPSLLSLVCRELNTARIAQHRKEISADLLAGSRNTILSEFYERAMADQPEGVRRVIEDDLLTESGYRESLAEERVRKLLAEAGAAPDALATLVNRRLLRIEDRLDMRRVELTHDVLCGVVQASRNARKEREARDAAEQKLAEQKAREEAARHALARAHAIVAVCVGLLVIAVAAGLFGWYSFHRARVAEAAAQKSRSAAEGLVSFMIEDFYNQLAPTGRLETLGALAQKTVAYYDTLPPNLVTRQTQINRAMALTREGSAQLASGQFDDSDKTLAAAQAVFKQMHDAGDHSEAVTYGLALALESQGLGVTMGNGHGTVTQLKQAANLLRPLVYGKNPSRRVRQLYADSLNWLTATGQSPDQQLKGTDEALKILAGLGALDLSNLDATSSYADTADSKARALLGLGRFDEARALEQQVSTLAEKLLAKRPGDLHALSDRFLAVELLGQLSHLQHDPAAAATWARQAVQAAEDEVRFNPSNLNTWSDQALALVDVAGFQTDRGELANAIATLESLLALDQDPRRPTGDISYIDNGWYTLAVLQTDLGDFAAAAHSLKGYQRSLDTYMAQLAPNDPSRLLQPEWVRDSEAFLQLLQGHPAS
jgi:tetratricopeptide (TPR) repeat protein